MAAKSNEYKTEENASRKRSQTERDQVEQATVEVNTIFWGGNGCGNYSVLPPAQRMLEIPGGTTMTMTQQAKKFPVGGNAPTSGITAKNLHRALMGGTPML